MGGIQEVGKERARGRSFKSMESGINKGKLHENAYYVAIKKWLYETKKGRESGMQCMRRRRL